MFNFLKSSKSDYIVPSETVPSEIPYSIPEKKQANGGYTVGINSMGFTTLTLIDGNSSITMTMSDTGINKLISLLQAALPEEHDGVEE
jgi:hypothetical protein